MSTKRKNAKKAERENMVNEEVLFIEVGEMDIAAGKQKKRGKNMPANEDRSEILDLIDMQFEQLYEIDRSLSSLASELFEIKAIIDDAILLARERHAARVCAYN